MCSYAKHVANHSCFFFVYCLWQGGGDIEVTLRCTFLATTTRTRFGVALTQNISKVSVMNHSLFFNISNSSSKSNSTIIVIIVIIIILNFEKRTLPYQNYQI